MHMLIMQTPHHQPRIRIVHVEGSGTKPGFPSRVEDDVIQGNMQLAIFSSDAEHLFCARISQLGLPVSISPFWKQRRCSTKSPISSNDLIDRRPTYIVIVHPIGIPGLQTNNLPESVVPICH